MSLPDPKPRSAAHFMGLLEIALPPEELRKQVAVLIATGLSKTRPSCVTVEKVKASELEGVANFVIGGLIGMMKESGKGH